jgi:DNA-binding NarL/FixJ family response regulator
MSMGVLARLDRDRLAHRHEETTHEIGWMSLAIALVEDDHRYRTSLERLVAKTPGLSLAGSYSDAEDALAVAAKTDGGNWDLVLMDLELPGISGIEATRRLKGFGRPPRVVVVTVFEEPGTVLQAICAGADGYLLKSARATEILDQIRAIADGGAPLTPGVARTLLRVVRRIGTGKANGSQSPGRMDLTPREQEVLRALVSGLAYKEVAAHLEIGLGTVQTHIKRIYEKLQVHSVAEAVGRAIREGLV